MAINLSKGQRVNVGLSKIEVGLGWQPAIGGIEPDLDASVFCIGENGKIPKDEYFIFYNNLNSPDGGIEHTGDVLTASADDDDEESVIVDLDKVDQVVKEIIFVVTIHDADSTSQNFGQVRDAYIRIINSESREEMMKYELSEDFSVETAVTIGRLYRRDQGWKFEAMGIGQKGGLAEYLQVYN